MPEPMHLINPEVRIENTNLCNSHCTICPREKLTRRLCTMGNEHFFSLVDQAKELGAKWVSVFGFGEPLMDFSLEEKIAYVTASGMKSFITTNASLLSENRAKALLEAGLTKIRFSVHGIGEGYEAVHRGLSWKKVFKKIIGFLAINDLDFQHSCTTAVSIIPMHKECLWYLRYNWERKVDELEIWRPHNWTNGKKFRGVLPRKKTCGRPFTGPVQINADGKMMVCCFDFNAEMTVGDTKEQTISDILRGGPFERIRSAHRKGDLSGLPCESCDQLNEEDQSPLLYSNVDPDCEVGKTSSTKFKLRS